jgi:hypothetical protein
MDGTLMEIKYANNYMSKSLKNFKVFDLQNENLQMWTAILLRSLMLKSTLTITREDGGFAVNNGSIFSDS